jgi:hypothetical protein
MVNFSRIFFGPLYDLGEQTLLSVHGKTMGRRRTIFAAIVTTRATLLTVPALLWPILVPGILTLSLVPRYPDARAGILKLSFHGCQRVGHATLLLMRANGHESDMAERTRC